MPKYIHVCIFFCAYATQLLYSWCVMQWDHWHSIHCRVAGDGRCISNGGRGCSTHNVAGTPIGRPGLDEAGCRAARRPGAALCWLRLRCRLAAQRLRHSAAGLQAAACTEWGGPAWPPAARQRASPGPPGRPSRNSGASGEPGKGAERAAEALTG